MGSCKNGSHYRTEEGGIQDNQDLMRMLLHTRMRARWHFRWIIEFIVPLSNFIPFIKGHWVDSKYFCILFSFDGCIFSMNVWIVVELDQ